MIWLSLMLAWFGAVRQEAAEQETFRFDMRRLLCEGGARVKTSPLPLLTGFSHVQLGSGLCWGGAVGSKCERSADGRR